MKRRLDWLERLQAYIEACRNRPHHMLEFNCAFFAAGAVEAVTGENPVATLRVEVASLRDVAEALKQNDGVGGLARKYFGRDMLPPLLAHRGDVVIKEGTDGDTLGVCVGDHALFLTEDGLQRRDLLECRGCWAVG